MILSERQLEELGGFDGPTICNALEVFNLRPRTAGFAKPGMVCRTPSQKPMIGYAATAKVSALHPTPNAAEKLIAYYAMVRDMADPTIAVIQDIDAEPVGSFWGEVQATTHMALGCVGTVTHGGVRDVREAGELGFQFYSTELHISHGYTHIEDFNGPVVVRGLMVHPGDLLFADMYGVVQIPHDVAPKLAEVCRKVAAAELPMLEPCRKAIQAGVKPTNEELLAWRKAMEQKRKE